MHHWWVYTWGHGRMSWALWGMKGSEPIWLAYVGIGCFAVIVLGTIVLRFAIRK